MTATANKSLERRRVNVLSSCESCLYSMLFPASLNSIVVPIRILRKLREHMAVEATLKKLQSLLYGYNYAVSLRSFHVPFDSAATVENYIHQVLPNSEIGGTQLVSGQEVLENVEQSLRYAGDAGSGPKPAVLNSTKFEELLAKVLSHLKQAVSGATSIFYFWLRKGHPDYPVYWDFAFVMIGLEYVEIFIGSSSD